MSTADLPDPELPKMVNGLPYFATVDGVHMNRHEWLDATRDDRKAKFLDELRNAANEGTVVAGQDITITSLEPSDDP